MQININILSYIYITICISLLLHNFLYIIESSIYKNIIQKRSFYWKNEILKQISLLENKKNVEQKHLKTLEKKLIKTKELIAYIDALDSLNEHNTFKSYLQRIFIAQQTLAFKYSKKDNMNRAFFAYSVSKYPPCNGDIFNPIIKILIGYLDNSTVYCRENVLNALYSLGNIQAIENALQILNDRQLFHHKKLLSDGLATFRGDKQKLMNRLWNHIDDWDKNIMISVVQFINICNGDYREIFLSTLLSNNVDIEIRLAIIRYYRKHFYEPVRDILYSFLTDENVDESLSIVAAFVLDKYPGKETVDILNKALHHTNWYVRYNAANSLYNLNIKVETIHNSIDEKDCYAKEILNYIYYVGVDY